MVLLAVPARGPGKFILLGSVLAWSLLGIVARAAGAPDPVVSVIALLGSAATVVTLDLSYRRRREIPLLDTRSSVWWIPTWLWAFALLALLPFMFGER